MCACVCLSVSAHVHTYSLGLAILWLAAMLSVNCKYFKESGRQNICRRKETKGKKARNKLFIIKISFCAAVSRIIILWDNNFLWEKEWSSHLILPTEQKWLAIIEMFQVFLVVPLLLSLSLISWALSYLD